MLPAIGAASFALDAVQSLFPSNSSPAPTTGFGQSSTNPFDFYTGSAAPSGNPAPVSGATGFSQLSPATMSALFAAQGQSSAATTNSALTSPSSALQNLFSQLDANGDGRISQSEFEAALGAGGTNTAQADSVFGKLDTNGDGSVSLSELSSALKGAGGKGHHHHAHAGGAGGSSDSTASGTTSSSSTGGSSPDALLQALQGASSTSVTNSDGSTTTSVTYADGSKVTMTSPAAATSSSSATSSYNIIEQMIQRQAQAISSGAISLLSVTA